MATLSFVHFTLKARYAFLEALGIDPLRVVNPGLKIDIPFDGVPTVTVTLHLDDERLGKLGAVMKQFDVVERFEVPVEYPDGEDHAASTGGD